jgi:hypothetical protein
VPLLRPKNAFITCRDRDDGGGAQIAARVSTMIFAQLRGLTYAHTPVTDAAHSPADQSAAEWSARWEDFFNLGLGETSAAEIEKRGLPIVPIKKPHRFLPRSNRFYRVAHCHKVTDRKPQTWAAIAAPLREKYFATPKPDDWLAATGRLRIAVHLRRGDVAASGRFSERFTATEVVAARLEKLVRIIGPERAEIRLFSQGEATDFEAFTRLGASLHLDEDVFESFHQMVRADILFTAISTFSYLAALIGGAQVIYEPYRHPRLPHWHNADEFLDLPDEAIRKLADPT